MAEERERIFVDDISGRQIATAEEATNGGAVIYRGDDAKRWREQNPDKVLKESKAAENKERKGAENKGADVTTSDGGESRTTNRGQK